MSAYETELLKLLPHTPRETVIIDVATVKKYTNDLFRKHASDRRFVSTHPMFGPESYRKHDGDVSGFRIVVTDYTLAGSDSLVLKNTFSALGFLVIEMTAEEHDKLLAETLFLTHYVGQTIKTAGFERTTVDTLSFSYLMDAVESVKNDSSLFQDVWRFNPYCQEVAERLHNAQGSVMRTLRAL